MFRSARILAALLLVAMAPAAASAQKDSKYTKEAEKFIGLAMSKSDIAARNAMYEQALVHLREGMTADAGNAKVWLMAGTVLAGLGQAQEADEAFAKAESLHPEYAADITMEREAGWVTLFNLGMTAMSEQRTADAVKAFEDAELLYSGRPEALLNLGALYANAGENEKAADAFDRAAVAAVGPISETLEPEQKQEWARFADMAKLNVAQIRGMQGAAAFEAKNFGEARAFFAQAAELNPHARDYVFNQVQALWAHTSQLEEGLAEKPEAEQVAIKAKLKELYADAEKVVRKTLEFDPNNEMLFMIEAQSHKMRGDLAPATEAKAPYQQATLKVLEAAEALPVVLDGVSVASGPNGESVISGSLTNRKLEAGKPVNVHFTLLGVDGSTVAQQTITVNVPAATETVEFSGTATATGEVAGWKYTIID